MTSSSTAKPWGRPSNPVGRVARILRKRYQDFAHHNRKNSLEELLFILCSVQTDEKKYRQTFGALRRAFPRFDDLASASAMAIAEPLKPGGLSPTKSQAIRMMGSSGIGVGIFIGSFVTNQPLPTTHYPPLTPCGFRNRARMAVICSHSWVSFSICRRPARVSW